MFDDPLYLLSEKEGNCICTSQHRRFGCIKKYTLIPGEVGVIQLDHMYQVDPAGQNVLVDPRQVVVAQVHLLQARLLGHQSAERRVSSDMEAMFDNVWNDNAQD